MKYFVVDAFTTKLFAGNAAGVCLLDEPIDEALMQAIAAENNLAETAFVLPQDKGYALRWFTPEIEVDLCGHATLASAFVLHAFADPNRETFEFYTASGTLTVTCRDDDLYEMDFPARPPQHLEVTPQMSDAIGCEVQEAYRSRDLMMVVADEATVADLSPDFDALRKFSEYLGVIVTAPGDEVDFVSRFFAPVSGIDEDPVTGSTHSTLIPFWAERLGKDTLIARQLSKRSGTLYCTDRGERVRIAGNAVLYLTGEIVLS